MATRQLLGPDGEPIRKAALLEELAGPTLSGVRRPYSDHPARGLTPARLARLLLAAEEGDPESYLALAEEIEEKDLHYLGVLGTRKRAVSQLEITVEAAEDKAPFIAHADFIRDWLRRDELEDELFNMLDAVGKGVSVVEIIWETSEKQWQPRRLEWRDPRWFTFDRVDLRTIMLRGDDGLPQPLQPYKFITTEIQAKSGIPIRGGLTRCVAWAYLFKNFGIKDWVSFLETYGQPVRIGRYPAGASDAEKRTLLRAVSQIGHDAAGIIPDSMTMELVAIAAKGDAGFKELADFFDQQVSKATLGQTGTTDAIAGGYAVGKVHDQVRQDIQQSDAKRLAVPINADLVRPMIDLNYGPQKAYPRVFIGLPDQTDMGVLMPLIERYVGMGGRVASAVVRDKLGLPDPAQGEELLQPRRESPALAAPTSAADPEEPEEPEKPEEPEEETATASATVSGATAQLPAETPADELDALAAAGLEDWRPMMRPVVDPIRALLDEMIAGGGTLEDFRNRLAELPARQDLTAVTEALARAGFVARAAGELEMPIDSPVTPPVMEE